MPKQILFVDLKVSYRNVPLYKDIKELKFEKTSGESWKEVWFDGLSPCTNFSFSMQAIHKMTNADGTEGDLTYSDIYTKIAETQCTLETKQHDENEEDLQDSTDYLDYQDTTTETLVHTPTPTPIQLVLNASMQQTVQVRL